MVRCVLFSNDERLVTQVKTWTKPQEGKLRLDTFASVELFKEYRANEEEGQRTEALIRDIEGNPEDKFIRVVLVDVDLVAKKPIQDLLDLQQLIRDMALVSALTPPRVMLLAHEGGAFKIEAYMQDVVDDLVVKPLDRQLFLQKLEILSSEDPNLKPTFLFNAKTDMLIEVGKDIIVDEVSEFAVSMRNPGPLNEGLYASIHADLFGTGFQNRAIGRVYESVKHPIYENEYLVRFGLFGITPEQTQTLRHFVKSQQLSMKVQKLVPTPPPKSDPRDLGAGPIRRRFAVVDMDPNSLNNAIDTIEAGFKNVLVTAFNSYSRLHADLLKLYADENGGAKTEEVRVEPSMLPVFPHGIEHSVLLRGGAPNDLIQFEPALKITDLVMGRPADEWIRRADLFMTSVDKEDREIVSELIQCAERGIKGKASFRMRDAQGNHFYLDATGALEKAGDSDGAPIVCLKLKALDEAGYLAANGQDAGGAPRIKKDAIFFRFDAIVIDASLVRPSVEEWQASFVSLLYKTGAIAEKAPAPKIFLMGENKAWIRPEKFRIRGIHDYFRKPLDRRSVQLKIQAQIPTLKLLRDLEAPAFVQVESQARIAKEVKMTELSEYGLAIDQTSPFRDRTIMRFFSPLFGPNGGAWVTARCRSCQKAEGTDRRPQAPGEAKVEIIVCKFIFFACSDDVLQRIRRWFREDYVAKK